MLQELYQQLILDHNKNPRGRREMPEATGVSEGYNPLCGDKVTVYVRVEDGVIADVSFVGEGCAISTASSSLLTDSLRGRTIEEADAIFHRFHQMLTTDSPGPFFEEEDLERLEAFSGVREFPARVKCASLAWHTFQAALHGGGQVTTEGEDA